MAPIVYFLGGVLVRATTKAIRDRLIAQGFRKATKGQIDSKIPTVTGTENNLISLITRAKNAIKSKNPVASGGRNTPRGTNKLGGSGQSTIGRKLGSRRMANFGKVRGGKGRAESMAKPPTTGGSKPAPVNKPVAAAKPAPAKANQQPRLSSGSTSRTVVRIKPKPKTSSGSKIVSATPTIASLVAAGALGKVAYDAYIEKYNPTVTQIKAAEKQIKAAAKDSTGGKKAAQAMVDARYTGSGVPSLTAEQKRELKKELKELAEKRNLDNKRSFKPETKKETREEPVRPKLRPKVVEAKPMSLGSYLNAEIKSRKSTVAKEKAKARKGDYKSIAEAKKAKSLYYIKDGKPMAAVYKRDLKGL